MENFHKNNWSNKEVKTERAKDVRKKRGGFEKSHPDINYTTDVQFNGYQPSVWRMQKDGQLPNGK